MKRLAVLVAVVFVASTTGCVQIAAVGCNACLSVCLSDVAGEPTSDQSPPETTAALAVDSSSSSAIVY